MNQVKEFIEYLLNSFKIWVIIQPWEQGIRVRFGKNSKLLVPGIHFKLPYFDSVYVQESRLRIVNLPIQTISSNDGKTITMNTAFGYVISDIEKLYSSLYHPETTLMNLTMSKVADYITRNDFNHISIKQLEEFVLNELQSLDFGLQFKSFEIMNYAMVRTYRLIQDHTWINEGLNMDIKKN